MEKKNLSLHERLAKIQVELKSPKSIYNEFGKFNYRSCEGILEAVKPMLNGDLVLLSDRMIMLGDRFYLEATAKFTDGKDSIEVTAFAREEMERPKMSDPQLTGTASSYARKYALGGLFLIDDAKNDPDGRDNTNGNMVKKGTPLKSLIDSIAKIDTAEELADRQERFKKNMELFTDSQQQEIKEAFLKKSVELDKTE